MVPMSGSSKLGCTISHFNNNNIYTVLVSRTRPASHVTQPTFRQAKLPFESRSTQCSVHESSYSYFVFQEIPRDMSSKKTCLLEGRRRIPRNLRRGRHDVRCLARALYTHLFC
ncbi:hypothetical protein IG631_17048 [Alternaria alternata]|nr:hypothetical protein IG631_17048 [Alternaria alternata]